MREQKKEFPILFVLATVLLLAGIAILLYPIVGNFLAERQRAASVARYIAEMESVTEEQINVYIEMAKRYNEYIYNRQQGNPIYEVIAYEDLIALGGEVMGTVDVPALGITSLPFYHGTAYETLDRGLGHFEQSTIPIGGVNTRGVITGHSGVHNQILFTEINRLQVGDIFFVNVFGQTLAYEVEYFEEILPTEVERVNIRSGRDMVTLLTCTPPGVNTYRLLVNGFRIPYEDAIGRTVTVRNLWNYERIVFTSLAVLAFIFLICFLRHRQLSRWIRSGDPIKEYKGTLKLGRLMRTVKIIFALLSLATFVILAFAIYAYIRMQEQAELGPLNIGVEGEVADYHLSRIMLASYEERHLSSVNISTYFDAVPYTFAAVNNWVIGKVLMPDSNIDLPILAGVGHVNMLIGASTYNNVQRLGRGNYVLRTHSVYENEVVLFEPLSFTEIGERIYATDFENVFIYEVFLNELVYEQEDDFAFSVDSEDAFTAELEEGETPIITLKRPEGSIGTRYRRIVQAELIDVEPLSEETLVAFNLVETDADPFVLEEDPVPEIRKMFINIAARMLGDPIQVALPIFFALVFPLLLINVLPAVDSKKDKKEEDLVNEMVEQMMKEEQEQQEQREQEKQMELQEQQEQREQEKQMELQEQQG